jgi:type 1 glutamine amidotransferase
VKNRFARFAFAFVFLLGVASAAEKKVLLIAGPPSHGPGAHEHNAGILLIQKCLAGVPDLRTEVTLGGWPKDSSAFDGAAAIIIFADGGPRHIALQGDHLAILEQALAHGAGLGLLHYAVEPTLAKGQAEFLRWVGGAFEVHWSVNPHWDAAFTSLPNHPITRGVRPFTIRDEWYFNLRFADGMKGVTPLLVARPDASTTSRPDGDHSGNSTVRAQVARGDLQTVSWAYERPGGGRGFGFTGAHFHANWAQDDFRKLVLNAVLWLAKIEVPAGGVQSSPTATELIANLDPKPAAKKAAAPKKPDATK